MIDLFKKVFGMSSEEEDDVPVSDQQHDIRIATCALFLEIANIDNEFSEEERQGILTVLGREYGLSEDDALKLVEASARELEGAIDMWQFTNLINKNYSNEEKIRVVELLWRIVYADGKLDAHEDFLVHKLAKLLRLKHGQLIAAKLRVLRGDSE